MRERADLIVFSDLDGTLLDHQSYSWKPAKPALTLLKEQGAMLVLASSKTASEIKELQNAMGLSGVPAIVENGSGVIHSDVSDDASDDYARLCSALAQLDPALRRHFRGFGDMSVLELADLTGLSQEVAAKAKDRHFSQPGIWSGDEPTRDAFLAALKTKGITARSGGRFLTLSFGRTKADAMRELTEQYRPKRTIALGDAPNDIEMLQTADIGVIVANPHGPAMPPLPGEDAGQIIRTTKPGPEGWSAALFELLASATPG